MEKGILEKGSLEKGHSRSSADTLINRLHGHITYLRALVVLTLLAFLLLASQLTTIPLLSSSAHLPPHAAATLARCSALHSTAGPPPAFHQRTRSDRFVPGTRPYLLKNAKLWTGRNNGTEAFRGDILLENGLIKRVGHVGRADLRAYKDDLVVVDVHDAWVTPGIVDMHSHLGDASSPALDGASSDDNSLKGPILPWLRSLDGLNTHDDSYALSIAGGVTTALVLPGSANAIGMLSTVIQDSVSYDYSRRTGLRHQAAQDRRTHANLHAP